MIDDSTRDVAAEWLAARLQARRQDLAQLWLDRLNDALLISKDRAFPTRDVLDHVPDLIQEIADYLKQPYSEQLAGQTSIMRKATSLAELRYARGTSVHQLLHEYQILGDVLEEFCQQELAVAKPVIDAVSAVRIVGRVMRRLRLLQQQTLGIFVGKYTHTIGQQTEQLRDFGRLVSHEIYKPLGVLQVVAKTLTVKNDVDAVRMMDIFDRSVAHLAEITDKLERLARITRATMPSEQVDLTSLAGGVAQQLEDMATARDVHVRVHEHLPVLQIDAVRAELVFVNVIANAIKFSDPGKRRRIVEVAPCGRAEPSVEVRDNGIGIPEERLQRIARALARPDPRQEVDPRRGLGLGLSLVRECMNDAGGSVQVESRQGVGTTFTLTWPVFAQTPRRGSPGPDGWSKIRDSS
jgi:signal transduction histidine kinase